MAKVQLKTAATNLSVDTFIDQVDGDSRREDCRKLRAIMERVTERPAVMWGKSIVGFGKYHYKYASGREGEFMMAGFSPRKTALTVYIMPGYHDFDEQLARLGPHKIGKSCLYIKRLSDIDESVLEEMVSMGVAYMREKYVTE